LLASRFRSPGLGPEVRKVTEAGVRKVSLAGHGIETIKAIWQINRIFELKRRGTFRFKQPTKFELAINLTTAKTLGLTINRDFQLIADEVIE
jgi:hypothetical protein